MSEFTEIRFYNPIEDSPLLEVEYQHRRMTPEECIEKLCDRIDAYESRTCEAHQPTSEDTESVCPYCECVKLRAEIDRLNKVLDQGKREGRCNCGYC